MYGRLEGFAQLSGRLLLGYEGFQIKGEYMNRRSDPAFYNQMNAREGGLSDYRDYIETDYRNLYNIYVQLQIHF